MKPDRSLLRCLVPCVVLLLAGCHETLLKDLSQDQANQAIALLYQNNIDARKVDEGKSKYRISVNKPDFSAAVDLLASHQLPSRAPVEISQVFPDDALVATPMAERARLMSAIEQRLEQTLRHLDRVVYARVHASYDMVKDDGPRPPTRISILITHEGEIHEALFIEKIKRLVKNSFQDVDYQDISVVLFTHNPAAVRSNYAESRWTNWVEMAAGGIIFVLMTGLSLWRGRGWLEAFRRRRSRSRSKPTEAPALVHAPLADER
jgi:type III secretion system YscJ/HrcJ family lipoprotein